MKKALLNTKGLVEKIDHDLICEKLKQGYNLANDTIGLISPNNELTRLTKQDRAEIIKLLEQGYTIGTHNKIIKELKPNDATPKEDDLTGFFDSKDKFEIFRQISKSSILKTSTEIENLQNQIYTLEVENSALEDEIQSLKIENTVLKTKLDSFEDLSNNLFVQQILKLLATHSLDTFNMEYKNNQYLFQINIKESNKKS